MSFSSSSNSDSLGGGKSDSQPDEYNLYLGFMIPIGAILALCIICLLVISWQLICPKCSKKFCPKVFADSFAVRSRIRSSNEENGEAGATGSSERRRATRTTSITLVRRYSDFPPSYETLLEQPPSYDSVVIIEEEAPVTAGRSRRNSTVRTYVYDPMRRVSIEVHDEDTIRVVEELLSRRRSSSWSSIEPPGYGNVLRGPDKYPTVQCVTPTQSSV